MKRFAISICLFLSVDYSYAQNILILNTNENNRNVFNSRVNITNQKVTNTPNFQAVQNDNAGNPSRGNFSQSSLGNLVQQSIPKQIKTNKTFDNKQVQTQQIGGVARQIQSNNPVNRVQQQRNSNPVQLMNDNKEINGVDIQVRQINIKLPEINEDIQVNEINLELNAPELPKVELPVFTASMDLDLSITKPEITLPEIVMPQIDLPKIKLPEFDAKEKTERKTKHSGYSQKGKNYTGRKIKIWFQKNFKIVHKIRLSVACPKF